MEVRKSLQEAVETPETVRQWYLGLSVPKFALVVAPLVGLGALMLWWAVGDSGAVRGLIGALLATIAALLTTDYTAAKWNGTNRKVWRPLLMVGLIGSLGLIAIANLGRLPALAFLGLALFTCGVGPFVVGIRDGKPKRPAVSVGVGMGLSLVGLLAVAVSGLPGWTTPVGLLLTVVGLGVYASGLQEFCTTKAGSSNPLRIFPGDCGRHALIAAALGIAVLVLGSFLRFAPVTVTGGWLTFVSLMALSVKPERHHIGPFAERAVPIVGAILVFGGGYLLWTTGVAGNSIGFLVFLVVILALFGSWIVWRGEIVFVGVLIGYAMVWGLVGYTIGDDDLVSSAEDGGDTATAGVVSFGDSFISGEGAPQFYDRTDQKGSDRNECRRAPTAYPALVSLDDDRQPLGADVGVERVDGLDNPGLDFYACSGAKAHQVVPLATTAEPTDDCEIEDTDRRLAQYPCGPDDVYGYRLQIDNLPPDRSATELVLLSIGGNDALFGDIVAGCLLPGSCAERREIWLDNAAKLGPSLKATYTEIKEAFGDTVPVVVMPYPLVLTEDSCADSPLASSEHEFVFEFTTVLNQQIEVAARQAGVHFFSDGQFAFLGHRLCEQGERAINLIKLQPTDGRLGDRLNPSGWTHNSMHPNPLGHELTAKALVTWLNETGIVEEGGNPEPDESARREILDLRPQRPFAVEPETVSQLLQGEPASGACDFGAVGAFATRIEVFDEQSEAGSETRAFSVPISGADPAAPICFTGADGGWNVRIPTTAEVDDITGEDQENEVGRVRVVDGQVFISGGRPGPECIEAFEGTDDDATEESICDFQWVLYSPPLDVAEEGAPEPERTWQFQAIRYCSIDPDCDDTFDDWKATQIEVATRQVAPLVGVIVLGGWLLALGWVLAIWPSLRSWLQRRFFRPA